MRKLVKDVIIARSGIYEYAAREIPRLELNLEDAPEKKDIYRVYRPSIVLSENAHKFTSLPLLYKSDDTKHPADFDDPDNWKNFGIGLTSEVCRPVWDNEDGEVALKSALTIADSEGIDAYMSGIKQVSPGYYGKFVWSKGKTPKGQDYDILMSNIDDVDHLIITKKARGGKRCRIADSANTSEEGGNMPKPKTSLIWRIKQAVKKLKGVGDSDLGTFRKVLADTVSNKTLSDEEVTAKIAELGSIMQDLPETEDKALLGRYVSDIPAIRSQSEDIANQAVNDVATLFETLDTKAMEEKPATAIAPVVEQPVGAGDAEETPDCSGTGAVDGLPTLNVPATNPEQQSENVARYTIDEIITFLQKMKSGAADTLPSTVQETTAKPNKLENNLAGKDKVMGIEKNKPDNPAGKAVDATPEATITEQPKATVSDSSPILEGETASIVGKDPIEEFFKRQKGVK